nr:sulfotransferase domain-containing protein [Paracraurococcus ruber]
MPARRRAVLLLRDPVDAAWSWYRRWEIGAEGMAFEEYLRRPGYFRWHLPYRAFQAPPLAVFALFVRFWQLAAEELLTLRFEDLKADPVGGTARLLDCMGTARPADAIAAAAGHGSFASLRSGAAAAAWAQVNRRSQVEEWRDRMTEAAHHALLDGPLMRGVAAEHGYRPAEAMPDPFRSDRPAWRMLAEICGRLLAENGGGQADPVQVASVVQDALRGQILGLLNIRIHNGASFDPEHTDALVGAMAALDLLREVFADRAPQPLSRLCRLLTGLAAVLAQGAALPEMRHAVQPLHVVPYAQGRL